MDSDGGELLGDFYQLNFVHDDELSPQRQQIWQLGEVGIHQKLFAAIPGVEIAQDAPLRIQYETVNTTARREVANVVAHHAIKPTHAIAASDGELCAPAQIVNTSARKQRGKFGFRIGEAQHSLGPAVPPQGARGRQLLS